MKTDTLERDVERYLDRRMKTCGGTTRKHASPGRRGAKDRLLIMPYRDEQEDCIRAVIWLCEVKKHDTDLRRLQAVDARVLEGYGVASIVVYTMEDADTVVADIDAFAKRLQEALSAC